MRYENQVLKNTFVELAGNEFINCTIEDSVVKVDGSAPLTFFNPKMDRVHFQFESAAANMLVFFQIIWAASGDAGVLRMINPGRARSGPVQ
jgi:hypothetical protein